MRYRSFALHCNAKTCRNPLQRQLFNMNRKTGHVNAGLPRRVGADALRRSMRRKLLLAFGASALAIPLGSFAQQQGKVWRVGVLSPASRPRSLESDVAGGALLQGMRELGYAEGKNLIM